MATGRCIVCVALLAARQRAFAEEQMSLEELREVEVSTVTEPGFLDEPSSLFQRPDALAATINVITQDAGGAEWVLFSVDLRP